MEDLGRKPTGEQEPHLLRTRFGRVGRYAKPLLPGRKGALKLCGLELLGLGTHDIVGYALQLQLCDDAGGAVLTRPLPRQ